MVKGYSEYLKEDCGCGMNTPTEIAPIEIFSKIANAVKDKQDTCPNCSKFPQECGCKGDCENCGSQNGGCDCTLNQDIKIGDIVRNVGKDCPQYKSAGRVVDMPGNGTVTFTVIKPGGDSSIGQLLNKSREQLTIDEKYRL